MNELQIFKYTDKEVRTVLISNEPYFLAKDVAEILGYTDSTMMYKRLDDDEKLTRQFDVSGQNRSMTIINESGLYNAIIGSKLPQVKH